MNPAPRTEERGGWSPGTRFGAKEPQKPASGTPVKAAWWHRAWVRTALLAVGMVGLVAIAYGPAWGAGFIWDDDDYVTHNPLLSAPDGLWRIWFSTDSPSQYFPLVYSTFRLEYALWGLNPFGYHAVNILLHALNALLVWRVLAVLGVRAAWVAAAVFALHPVQVESVAWVSELKNVQSLFFCLLATLAWIRFLDTGRAEAPPSSQTWARSRAWFLIALGLHALALFSKTTACTLPAAFLLILWWRRDPVTLRRALQLVPFLLTGLAMGLVSIWWERHHQGTVGDVYSLGAMERLLVASRAVWFYLGKLLWPVDLTFNYPLWKIETGSLPAYLWLAACAAAGGLILWGRRRLGRGPETALAFFVLTLAPLLGFVMLYTFIYTFVTDHYQYVAMIGPVALAIGGGAALSTRWPAVQRTAAALLVAVLVTLTWRQARMYHDLETLWTVTLARNPDSSMGHNNLGAIRLQQGRAAEAVTHFERAIALRPGHANAMYNLGRALLQLGRPDEAIRAFQDSLAHDATDPRTPSDLALALLEAGRPDEALAHAAETARRWPDYAEGRINFGAALQVTGQMERAIEQFQAATGLNPQSAAAWYNLGTAWLSVGNAGEAGIALERAAALDPGSAATLHNWGHATLAAGDANVAGEQFARALELEPSNPLFHASAGWAHLQARRPEGAIAAFERALHLGETSARVRAGLVSALLAAGRPAEAVTQYRALLEQLPDDPRALSGLAWLLATTDQDKVRSGPEALELSTRANALSGNRDPVVLRSLAAAYAENGRFAEAVDAVERALALLTDEGVAPLVKSLQSQQAEYRAQRPLREAAGLSAL